MGFQIALIAIGFVVGLWFAHGSRNRCMRCHERICFWQSRAFYPAAVRRAGWYHTKCDGTSVLGAPIRLIRSKRMFMGTWAWTLKRSRTAAEPLQNG